MGIPLKIVSTIGVLGTVGGGLAMANHFSTDTIKDKLEKVGYQLLDNLTEDTKKVLDAYQAKGEKLLGEIKDEAELKSKCDSILTKKDEKNYALASKWCVKEETIMSMLGRNKFTPIKAVSGGGKKDQWEAKVNEMKDAKTNGEKITEDFKDVTDVNTLEKTCENLTKIKTHEKDDYEIKYLQSAKWCAEKEITNA